MSSESPFSPPPPPNGGPFSPPALPHTESTVSYTSPRMNTPQQGYGRGQSGLQTMAESSPESPLPYENSDRRQSQYYQSQTPRIGEGRDYTPYRDEKKAVRIEDAIADSMDRDEELKKQGAVERQLLERDLQEKVGMGGICHL